MKRWLFGWIAHALRIHAVDRDHRKIVRQQPKSILVEYPENLHSKPSFGAALARRQSGRHTSSDRKLLSRQLAREMMRLERTSCQCWQGHDRVHTSQPRTRDVNAGASSCSRVPSLATKCSQGLDEKVLLETRTCHRQMIRLHTYITPRTSKFGRVELETTL